jgi:Holliday junction resolvase RusA-like endonuclease
VNLSLTLYGDPRTKKNSRDADYRGRVTLPSKAYRSFRADCLKQITGEHRKRITDRVNVRCLFFMKRDYITTKGKIDLTGLLQAIDDILVDAGVIEDDCCRIVAGHDGSRVLHDKENPRVEIEITSLEEEP